jgi:hypothetical protein
MQEPPAATLPAQGLVSAKSVLATIPTVSAAVPVLLRVTGCDGLVVPKFWLVNTRLDGETAAMGAVLVPLKVTVCMLPVTPLLLSVMVRVPARGPTVAVSAGEKTTLIVQEPPAATLPVQVLVSPKLALAPMLAMVSAAAPVLLRVTGSTPLVVPNS